MIHEFKGQYAWLSNFASCIIILQGIKYPSVEHAYMSAKSDDEDWKAVCANFDNSPGFVKRSSRNITLVRNWDLIKVDVMKECLWQKFVNNPEYRDLLINTGDQYLQEGNRWGDKFWGVCLKTGEGRNQLGKLIMSIRSTLIS